MQYTNHLVDPTIFNEAIEEFAFDYECFIKNNETLDEHGRKLPSYIKQIIRGSLQSQGKDVTITSEGNTTSWKYNFYCESLYRIDVHDYIIYKDKLLHVDSVHDYDEWGVREASLTSISISGYKELDEYMMYIRGEIIR